MDVLPRRGTAPSQNRAMTEEQRVQTALRKARLERAKMVVSKSFDRSLGKLKRNRKKHKAAHSESFVLRRAAALEEKNRDIVSALAKSRQQSSQLERIVIRYRENEMSLAMKLGSYQRKIREMNDKLNKLKSQLAEKDDLVGRLQKLFSSGLTEIAQSSDGCESSCTVNVESVSTHQPLRIPRLKRKEVEDSSSSSSSDEDVIDRLSGDGEKSISDQMRSQRATARSRSTSPVSDLSAVEECSDSSEEEDSDCNTRSPERSSLNVATQHERSHNNALEDVGREEGNCETHDLCEGPVTRDTDQTLANIRLSVSFSSDDGAKSSDADEANMLESKKDVGDNSTSNNTKRASLSMKRSAGSVDDSQANVEPIGERRAERNRIQIVEPTVGFRGKRVSRGKAALKDNGNKNKNVRKKPPSAAEQKNVYDFLSCSADSFVDDPSKTITLNSSRSSVPSVSESKATAKRYSDPGTENEENVQPGRRSGRRKAAVSYAEPSLNKKLRRGHPISDKTVCESFSPKSRKRNATSKRVRSK